MLKLGWIELQKQQPEPGREVLAITEGGRPTSAYLSLEGEWRISFGWNYMPWRSAYDTPPTYWMELPEKPQK